jgi:hypothetical protein
VVRGPKKENTQHATRNTQQPLRITCYVLRVTALIAAIAFAALAATPSDWYGADFAMPEADAQTQLHKIIEMIRAAPSGTYFADDPGVLALAGKTTEYDDPFTMTALAAAGRWDATAFETQLRGGHFPLVILAGEVGERPGVPLRSDILTPAMRAALLAGYRELYRDVLFTYVPK